MTALAAVLLCVGLARAEARNDGTNGGFVAPTAEMLPAGKTAFTIGMGASFSPQGGQAGVLPFGAGFSYARNTEVGFLIDSESASAADGAFGGTTVGLRYRNRVLGRDGARTPLVLEASATGLTGRWSGELAAVTGFNIADFQIAPSLGVGWWESGSFGGAASLVVARYVHQRLRVLMELRTRAGVEGLEAAEARAGLRVSVHRRVHAVGWTGGGVSDGEPWGGGGLTIVFYATDPLELDRDGDKIPDWQDRCPGDAEDEDKFEDYDGCPDPDNDGDNILDADDPTPNGEAVTPLRYAETTPLLRMRIHERGFQDEDPDAP